MLGIDTSKEQLVCALYDTVAQRFRWEQTVPRTEAGVRQLLERTPPEVPWVLEPTGRYSLFVAKQARDAGRRVLLAPPRKAKAYLQSVQSRAKTDRLDGRGLALFGATRPASEALPPYPIKSPVVEQLDQLLTARKGLVEAGTSLRLRIVELPHAAGPLRQAVADLEAQRAALDRQIAQLTADREAFPAVPTLRKVPGIGPVTAAAVASRLRDRTFRRADQFVAYIGLDVDVRQSGKRKGERGLTKQGDAELRRLFFLAAQSTVRTKDSPFRVQYERELQKGLSRTAALNAVARKLARLCWSLVHHNTEYDPARVQQQGAPAPAEQASPEQASPSLACFTSPATDATQRVSDTQPETPAPTGPVPVSALAAAERNLSQRDPENP
jgi:transposase